MEVGTGSLNDNDNEWQWNDFIAMKLHSFHSVYKTTYM